MVTKYIIPSGSFLTILFVICDYLFTGNWNNSWAIVVYILIITLITLGVILLPIGGSVIGILYICLNWDLSILITFGLTPNIVTTVITWLFIISGIVLNIIWTIIVIFARDEIQKIKGFLTGGRSIKIKI